MYVPKMYVQPLINGNRLSARIRRGVDARVLCLKVAPAKINKTTTHALMAKTLHLLGAFDKAISYELFF
jgi:hypothetical protein